MYRIILLLAGLFFFSSSFEQKGDLPEGFAYVKTLIPDIMLEMRYGGSNNFLGRPVTGYEEPHAILTLPAAEALVKVQQELKEKGYCLKIFDAYRPQRAVNQFVKWSKNTEDTIMKKEYYPQQEKRNLFNLGYIASRSGHSRGSTVDLTLIDASTGQEINMGSSYDFFGNISHHNSPLITKEQKENRELLKNVMMKYGFQPYWKEWWHYTYQPEPFPDTYFDFVID